MDRGATAYKLFLREPLKVGEFGHSHKELLRAFVLLPATPALGTRDFAIHYIVNPTL